MQLVAQGCLFASSAPMGLALRPPQPEQSHNSGTLAPSRIRDRYWFPHSAQLMTMTGIPAPFNLSAGPMPDGIAR